MQTFTTRTINFTPVQRERLWIPWQHTVTNHTVVSMLGPVESFLIREFLSVFESIDALLLFWLLKAVLIKFKDLFRLEWLLVEGLPGRAKLLSPVSWRTLYAAFRGGLSFNLSRWLENPSLRSWTRKIAYDWSYINFKWMARLDGYLNVQWKANTHENTSITCKSFQTHVHCRSQ